MEKESQDLKELNDALRELRDVVYQANIDALAAKDAVNELLNHSHLKSALTLFKEDVALRRLLQLQSWC